MWKILVLLTLVSLSVGQDTQAPTISCPTNVTSNNYDNEQFGIIYVRTDDGKNAATVTWDDPVASDDSGEVNVTSSPYESGDTIPIPSSLHTITFTATDSSGNTANCSLLISVLDVEAPTCSINPITVSAEMGDDNATISYVITVSDNVQVSSIETEYNDVSIGESGQEHVVDSVFKEIDSIGTFPLGVTEVMFTVVDSASPSGNVGSCLFQVTIKEFTPTTFRATTPTIDGKEVTETNEGNDCKGSFHVLVGILCLYSFILHQFLK